jgi:hypothetical protein
MSNFLCDSAPSFCQSDDCFLEIPSSPVGDFRGDFRVTTGHGDLVRGSLAGLGHRAEHLFALALRAEHVSTLAAPAAIRGARSRPIGRSFVSVCFPKWEASGSRSNINGLALLGGFRGEATTASSPSMTVAPRSLIQASSVNGLSLITYFPVTCSSCQASRHSAGLSVLQPKDCCNIARRHMLDVRRIDWLFASVRQKNLNRLVRVPRRHDGGASAQLDHQGSLGVVQLRSMRLTANRVQRAA